MRSRISPAGFIRERHGGNLACVDTFDVDQSRDPRLNTRVFPEPAPASTSNGPST